MTDDPDAYTQFDDAVRRLGELQLSDEAKHRHLMRLANLPNHTTAYTQRPRNRRRRVLAAIAAAVVASGVGVGAAAALGAFRSEPPTDRRIARCYATDSLIEKHNFEEIGVAVGAGGGNPSLRDAASSALDICRGGWLQGRYSATDPEVVLNPKPPPWNYPVPPLVACVLESGQVGVFPGTEATCEGLGLAVAEL